MFAKPEPTLNKIQIDKLGNVDVVFSNEMVFPDNWVQMYEQYVKSRRLQLGASGPVTNKQPFLIMQTRNALTGEISDMQGS